MSDTHEEYPDTYHDVYSNTIFGFWIYLLTDFVLFGVMFATYAVLHKNNFGGPTSQDLFDLGYAFGQTLVLLAAAYTVGVAGNFLHRRHKKGTIVFFGITFLLGLVFITMQFNEFSWILRSGSSWKTSAFLSSYFTLVGVFSFHMFFALLWILVLIVPVCLNGVDDVSIKRLTCLKMFWQFLNLIWIFVFSMVYLLGVV